MRAIDVKRQVGYADLVITDSCGSCANCTMRGKHLRCAKHGFAVTALGICRSGYRKGLRQRELTLKLIEYKPEVAV